MKEPVFLGIFRRYRVQCCEHASASSAGCRSGTYAFVRVIVAIAVLDRLCLARGATQQSSAAAVVRNSAQHLRFVRNSCISITTVDMSGVVARLAPCYVCATAMLAVHPVRRSHRARCSNQHKQQQAILRCSLNCCRAAGARQSCCQLRSTRDAGSRGLV